MSLQSRGPIEYALPRILGCLEAPFLRSVELQFHLEAGQRGVEGDWGRLQSALLELHFFGMSSVRIYCALSMDLRLEERAVERSIRAGMHELDKRRALMVRVGRTRMAKGDQVYYGWVFMIIYLLGKMLILFYGSPCFEDYKS